MPIYEYKCQECETIFEFLTLSRDSEEKAACSRCNSENVSKLISAGTIRSSTSTTLPSTPPAGCGGPSGFS